MPPLTRLRRRRGGIFPQAEQVEVGGARRDFRVTVEKQDLLWLVNMLDLGFDEGGKVGDRLLVSVQIGSTGSMTRLQRDWQKAVRDAGIRFFHSKDYRNFNKGEFAGLSWTRRKRLLKTLAAMVHKRADIGITAWVDTKLFDRAASKLVRARYVTPYAFALTMSLAAAHLYKERVGRDGESLNLLIARGHPNLSQGCARLAEIKSDGRLNIKAIGVGAMNDFGILQAADMLVYGEWQKLTGSDDLEIYNALHRSGSRYSTLVFDCETDLIELLSQGVGELEAAKKAFGNLIHRPAVVS